jgi:hypothetical protein
VPPNAADGGSGPPNLDELITLRETAAERSGLSASHLRLLVSRGDIWRMKLGRNWVTTAQAVEEYLTRDRRPGPKPKRPRDQPKFLSLPVRSGLHYLAHNLPHVPQHIQP